MRRDPVLAVVSAGLAIVLASGCGQRQLPKPVAPVRTQVVLLPAPEGNPQGRVAVTNKLGTVELSDPSSTTQATTISAPTPPAPLGEADVQRLFGDAVANLPADAEHFTLYFLLDSDELTPESKSMFPAMLKAVAGRSVPEVTIIGHTDTRASAESNYALGLKRAGAVRAILTASGLNPDLIETSSHGEAELLVATPDNTYESRNRRVEIVIK
jgi:outer membrane protein OmpA-like peptidoglycan-associated protein